MRKKPTNKHDGRRFISLHCGVNRSVKGVKPEAFIGLGFGSTGDRKTLEKEGSFIVIRLDQAIEMSRDLVTIVEEAKRRLNKMQPDLSIVSDED